MSLRLDQKPVVATVYVAAMFMAVMDTTIVNVALPTIGSDLHARAGSVGLVSIAYLVSLAVFIPASGWLGDLIGGKRALLGAIGLFTLASALCGISTGLDELVAFRVLQGVGGAVMTPVGLAMLFRVYPPAERVRISGVLALVTALAPALGPILGGVFTTYASWRLAFFVNVPIGAATLAYGVAALAGHVPARPGRLDVKGLLLSGLGLGSVMYGICEGPSRGWTAAPVLAAAGAGAALLAALVLVESRAAHPLVDLRLFGNRMFACATGLYGLGSVAYLGALFLASLFFQDALGLSAVRAGLTVFPSALGVMAGGQLVTRVLYRRFGPRRIAAAGLLVMAGTLASMTGVGTGAATGSGTVPVLLAMLGLGLGVSFVFIPSQAASMATVSKERTGRASSLFNAGKQLGGAVGVALLSSVLAATGPARGGSAGRAAADLGAYHAAFLVAAAVSLLALPVALAVRDADAAATMAPRQAPRPARQSG
ncbi:MDR family MFS transporter [Streptomyces sp. CA2R106]|uniref:MDR family MFS transporter n=1 Tax=Streptomyces sp. CA2R106 TaxID=3120153 RepID=UPI00300B8897